MTHEIESPDEMISMLEVIWGSAFAAPDEEDFT